MPPRTSYECCDQPRADWSALKRSQAATPIRSRVAAKTPKSRVLARTTIYRVIVSAHSGGGPGPSDTPAVVPLQTKFTWSRAIAHSDVKQALPLEVVIPTATSELGQTLSATREHSMSVNSLPLKGLLQTFHAA